MPPPQEILTSLATIANRAFSYAVAWHGLVAVALVTVALGWRPGQRVVSLLSCAPLASVSVIAWLYGNPFNGSVFALLATTLAVLSARVPNAKLSRSAPWAAILGIGLIAF